MSKIIVLAEQQFGELANATFNAIGAAQQLAQKIGGTFDIAIAGQGIAGLASKLSGFGAAAVYVLEDAALENYTAQAYAQAFGTAVTAAGATFVIAPATSIGKDCTPRVAARLKAGMASDVVSINGSATELTYDRPMWAGNLMGRVKINTAIQVLTVRPTEFPTAAAGSASAVKSIAAGIDASSIRMKWVKLDSVKSSRPALTDASVVVAGGRGLKEPENFEKVLAPLADHLSAAIGATRAVVDAGWVPNDWQVGQTGKVVAPNLYIAMGISGAIQHLAGMKGSKTIVAINKDAEAPIFQVADYGLVADLFNAVPELTEKLKNR
ncbi:MAG: electron transfer flavoprotein alpha subunit [Bradymonadia bacterium]|jgi:electron transfer flavoprotein alpha subunit